MFNLIFGGFMASLSLIIFEGAKQLYDSFVVKESENPKDEQIKEGLSVDVESNYSTKESKNEQKNEYTDFVKTESEEDRVHLTKLKKLSKEDQAKLSREDRVKLIRETIQSIGDRYEASLSKEKKEKVFQGMSSISGLQSLFYSYLTSSPS